MEVSFNKATNRLPLSLLLLSSRSTNILTLIPLNKSINMVLLLSNWFSPPPWLLSPSPSAAPFTANNASKNSQSLFRFSPKSNISPFPPPNEAPPRLPLKYTALRSSSSKRRCMLFNEAWSIRAFRRRRWYAHAVGTKQHRIKKAYQEMKAMNSVMLTSCEGLGPWTASWWVGGCTWV